MFENTATDMPVVSFGPFRLYAFQRRLTKLDLTVPIGNRALDILIELVQHAGEVVSHRDLIAAAWPGYVVENSSLRVQIAHIRKVLGCGVNGVQYLSSIAGRGYCFVAPVSQAEPSVPDPRKTATHWRVLPRSRCSIHGRDGAIDELSKAVSRRRLTSIVGPGGIGKTTVAIAVANAVFPEFKGEVIFIDLSSIAEPGLLSAAIAKAFGVRGEISALHLQSVVGPDRTLIVFDNCDHLIEAVATTVSHLLANAPELHFLTTTREALRMEEEDIHLLPALAAPPLNSEKSVVEILGYPTVRVFMDSAISSGYVGQITEPQAASIAHICNQLDGIPLALELAGSQVGLYGIDGTAELINAGFSQSWSIRRSDPRHQTIDAMLDWSYNLLAEPEKAFFCKLSVFVGFFSADAAAFVGSEVDDKKNEARLRCDAMLSSLVRKSLLVARVIDDTMSYRMLETTRAYGLAKLGADRNAAALRHAEFYTDFLGSRLSALTNFVEPDLAVYEAHLDNIRAALDWACLNKMDVALGAHLAARSAVLYISLSLYEECRYYCSAAIADLPEGMLDTLEELILQGAWAVSTMFTAGHDPRVLAGLERALSLAERFNNEVLKFKLLIASIIYTSRAGNVRRCSEFIAKMGTGAKRTRLPPLVIEASWMKGYMQYFMGNQSAAEIALDAGFLRQAQEGGTTVHFYGFDHGVISAGFLARVRWLRGLPLQALSLARNAISEAIDLGSPYAVSVTLLCGIEVFLWCENYDEAEANIDRFADHAHKHNFVPFQAVAQAMKGQLALMRGDLNGFKPVQQMTRQMAAQHYGLMVSMFSGALANAKLFSGRQSEALIEIDAAIKRAHASGVKFHLPDLLRTKASIILDATEGTRQEAEAYLRQSLKLARRQSALSLELRAASDLAQLLSDTDGKAEGREILSDVYCRFREGFETRALTKARLILDELS